MKYQAIDVEYYKNLQELKEFEYMKKLMYKGLKYGYFLFVFIIILSAFLNGNLVLANPTTIEYDFQNNYAYNGGLPESSQNINQLATTEPSGIYNATYSFENDVGKEFDDLSDFIHSSEYQQGDSNVIIMEELDGHSSVLNISSDNGDNINCRNEFPNQETGIIEIWIYCIGSGTSRLYIGNGTHNLIFLKTYPEYVRVYYGDGVGGLTYTVVGSLGWNHFRIDFDCILHSFSVWVNSILELENINFLYDVEASFVSYLELRHTEADTRGYYDAIGYSWDYNTISYFMENDDLSLGSYIGGVYSDTYSLDNNRMIFQSQSVEESFFFLSYDFMNAGTDSEILLSCNITLSKVVNEGFYIYYGNTYFNSVDNQIILLDNVYYNNIGYGANEVLLSISDNLGIFYIYIDYLELKIITGYNYVIGDNLLCSQIESNITVTDKFEFTYDNTGNINENGDDNVNGFTDIENDYWSSDVVNVVDSIDDDIDKAIRIYRAQSGNCGIERDFDVYVNTSEVWWEFDLIQLGYPECEIYTRIENKDGDQIAFFKLVGSYWSYGSPQNTMDLYFNIDGNWEPVLITDIPPANNYNLTFKFTWNINNEYGVLSFEGTNYPIYIHYSVDKTSLGKIQIYAINDNNIVLSNLDLQIDWMRIIINGSSISDEVYPQNLFILCGHTVNLLYQPFIEITFDYTYDNNVSIYLNDVILLLDYTYNTTANYIFTTNIYRSNSYLGLFLRISNSSEYKIDNIKVYGIQLVNQLDSNDNSFLEFDYSNVNPNSSYFYVVGNDLYYHLETTNNSGLEYIQATFDIFDLICEGYSISFTHKKDFTYLESECKVLFTSDTYLSFISLNITKSVSLILPQDKVIKEIIFLITDNNNEIIDTSEGYFSDLVFMYYQDIDITITTISLFDILPIVIIVILIPIALYLGFGKRKELLIPSIIGMSIFGAVIEIVPLWLLVVIIFSGVSVYLIDKARGN